MCTGASAPDTWRAANEEREAKPSQREEGQSNPEVCNIQPESAVDSRKFDVLGCEQAEAVNRRLLDRDHETGVETWHSFDPVTDTTTIETVQDVEPFLEHNKAIQKIDGYSKQGIKNEWWHIACIPIGVQYKWLKEKGVNIYNKDHWPAVRRLLSDPDWRYLRTGTGKL